MIHIRKACGGSAAIIADPGLRCVIRWMSRGDPLMEISRILYSRRRPAIRPTFNRAALLKDRFPAVFRHFSDWIGVLRSTFCLPS